MISINKGSSKREVSVIVCTYGEAKYLTRVLLALNDQTYKDFEVIIVDNNPVATGFIFSDLNFFLRITHCPEVGLVAARNWGIDTAKGDFILFLDDDAIPKKDWIKNIIMGFKKFNADMVGGRVELELEEEPFWVVKGVRLFLSELTYKSEDISDLIPPRYVVGANMGFRKTSLMQYGNFYSKSGRVGKQLISLDDVEILRRIHNGGGRISFINSALVKHMIPRQRVSLTYLFERAFWQGMSDVLLEKIQPLKVPKKCKLPPFDLTLLLELVRFFGRIRYQLTGRFD